MRTQEKLLKHEQEGQKLNPNFLDSSASVVRTPRRCASFLTDVALRTLWPTQLNTALKRSVAKPRHKHRIKREKDHGTHFTLMYHYSQLYAVKSMNLRLSQFYTWSAPLPRLGQLPWRTPNMSKMWNLDLLHFCTVIALGVFNQSSNNFVFEVLKRRSYIYHQSAAHCKPRVTKWTPHNHFLYHSQRTAREWFLVVRLWVISESNDCETSANG